MCWSFGRQIATTSSSGWPTRGRPHRAVPVAAVTCLKLAGGASIGGDAAACVMATGRTRSAAAAATAVAAVAAAAVVV
eukprot:CAMPEP_0175128562 /NCGR_PEP_ID=MMETSP0087-20121206/4996_1 /TAXON_ID=136419 /ORGANISM="Unknown Unknown, Strain D1" /LENGTH=77 /DNA_ID=CAMNT_0016410635 /DNA_START=612 /DNA_END=841 /DNA_ORIENTATION=-